MSTFATPLSRNEAILQNCLGADNEIGAPQSRIEALLQELCAKMVNGNDLEYGTLEPEDDEEGE